MSAVRRALRLATPPYFFQPLQVFKRFGIQYASRGKRDAVVTLPWGLPIRIDLQEAIGHNIATQGLYEIAVTETLWRLTDPGDLAIDAGANIGYTASILGVRAGPKGKVICFEPHPGVFASLVENVELWKSDPRCAPFVLHQAALGKTNGKAQLHTNSWFQANRGTAWVSAEPKTDGDLESIEVPVLNLDTSLDRGTKIGVLKMDVQGSELDILEGMTGLLEQRTVRDIVFEEHANFPAPTHRYLQSKGYSILGLQESFAGVDCLADAQPRFDPATGPIPNYLATVEPDRAKMRMSPRIWRSFGAGRVLSTPESEPKKELPL